MASVRQTDPGAELHLIVGTEGPLVEQAERLGVRVAVFPMPNSLLKLGDSAWKGRSRWARGLALALRTPAGWAGWRYVQQLSHKLRDLQPDLLYSNGLKFHILSCLAGPRSIPVIWHLHDFLSPRPIMAQALRLASRRASMAIAISRAVAQDARAVLPCLPIELVYNAIDTDYFSPGPGDGHRLDAPAALPRGDVDRLPMGCPAD